MHEWIMTDEELETQFRQWCHENISHQLELFELCRYCRVELDEDGTCQACVDHYLKQH